METFWTVCPYCYYMFEYGKMYEDFCLRCQNCRRAFHGMAVKKPKRIESVDGGDGRYHRLGFFEVKYDLSSDDGNACKKNGRDDVVDISDDSGDVRHGGGSGGSGGGRKGRSVKADGYKVNFGGREAKVEGIKVNMKDDEGNKVNKKRNVKSVPRNSKKIMGRGLQSRNELKLKEMDLDSKFKEAHNGDGNGDGCFENDLEFIEKDGDVYVGIK